MEKKDVNTIPGLPMGLAETRRDGNFFWQNAILGALQKILIFILFLVFIVALYVLILKLLVTDAEKNYNTEIFVFSNKSELSQITFPEKEIVHNQIREPKILRRKRDLSRKNNFSRKADVSELKLHDIKLQKVKKILSDHDVLCNDDIHREVCKEIVNRLKRLTENNILDYKGIKAKNIKYKNIFDKTHSTIDEDYRKVDIIKRETMIESDMPAPVQFDRSSNILQPYPNDLQTPQLTEDCLLTRLMRQSENIYGYDESKSEYDPNFPTYPRQVPIDFLPPYARGYDRDIRKYKPHPQDIEIALNLMSKQIPLDFLASYTQGHDEDTRMIKPHPQDIETALNIKSNCRPAAIKDTSSNLIRDCPANMISCDNGDCISEKLWCNGNVDCEDVSDESRCSCRERVDITRVCDGYFDCPFGEDEMGCFGCKDNTFSCDNQDSTQSKCFTMEQRCNNIADCANHKDEADCTMLAPSLHKNPLFAVSNTEGFLHRNYKGIWYAVCNNPYMWAHDACRRETGLIIRPPFIQFLQIDPMLKVNYLNTAPGGLIHNSTTCLNSSAVYVTCPDLLCGTRIMPTTQLIRENAENQLFGRNKRFLLHNYPYHFFIYDPMSRSKRNTAMSSEDESNEEIRSKRTESRVVGGKPSQPAAWPWVVALYRDGLFHCGGVIVNQNWIMSAAHCVHKYWQHYYEVQVGMLRRFSFSPQEQNYRVTHVIVNQNYDQQDMKNDLSLLKVKPAIQFSRWVRPICLPGPEVAGPDWLWGPPVGTICTAVGWGSTIEHGPDPDHLREVELPIWENCNHQEDQAGKEICAGFVEGGKDTCQGDSGGPLLCQNPANEQQWYVAGIVSHGDGCARKGEPGVYTRVSLLVPWIKYHTSSKSLPMIQPKQECPGFRCNSGISKCLPKNRMYDKIIDCLDGEDEINCEIKESRNIIEDILSIPFGRNANTSTNLTNELVKHKEPTITNTAKTNQSILVTTDTTTKLPEVTTAKDLRNIVIMNSTQNNVNVPVTQTSLENDSKTGEIPEHDTTEDGFSNDHENSDDLNEHVTNDSSKITTTESSYTQKIEITPEKVHELISSMGTENNNVTVITEAPIIILPETESNFIISVNSDSEIPENSNKSTVPLQETTTDAIISTTDIYTYLPITNTPIDDEVNTINTIFSNVTESPSNIDDIESEIVNDIIYAVEATKYKTKHKTPSNFQCRKIFQMIVYKYRCDHKADCEDGTDELDCTCLDYLTTFDSQLICDGNYDCADGQDEIDCFGCDEGQFLCKRSQMCLSTKYICDGKTQCPLGEDELDCLALTNGKDVKYDLDGRPKVRFEGYVTKKQNNDWHVICEENMTIHDQEETAVHICRYLGFSNANSYKIKYINIKENNLLELPEDNKRTKRNKINKQPVTFTYTKFDTDKKESRNVVIMEPEVLKEQCIPNITKTCMSLYVVCDQSLYTNFDEPRDLLFNRAAEDNFSQQWPWVAKLYTNGHYRCTGVLIDMSWVLFSNACMDLTLQNPQYNTVILGSHKTLFSTKGFYEQVYKIDAIKDLYRSKVILLHLSVPAEYSSMVKPMIPPSVNMGNYKRSICIAVGEDASNNTLTVLLKETLEDCSPEHLCFVRQFTADTCLDGFSVNREWAGIISCHTKQGWYPAASFIEPRGECNMGNRLTATEIGNLKYEIKYYKERPFISSNDQELLEDCEGIRCKRGRCVNMQQVCDGVKHCEDGIDEAPEFCEKKNNTCFKDPFQRGCACPVGQLKCRNGHCVSKELFNNGRNDCVDGTDEPAHITCSDYLSRVKPSRLCDGVLHCHDRSDEDPMFCKCFAKHAYRCGRDAYSEDFCVALDMVCDGIPDCPNGEDEQTCIGLSAPQGTPPGIGEVIVRSHGVWYSKCYPTQNHIKSDLEDICRELGFISGHAKQLPTPDKTHPHNNLDLDQFSDIILNNSTKIKLRNSDTPIARGLLESLSDCFPLFLECM